MSNPFIHQRPIKSEENLIGRDEELENLTYVLDQAVSENPKYENIAISGQRGLGKSSLSKILQEKADEKGILTTEIRLDSHEVQNPVDFFELVLDRITEEIGGKTREKYLNLLKDKADEVELRFKILKIRSQNDNQRTDISSSSIRDDLSKLLDQTDSEAILLTIDNAQHLKEKPEILQKIKNTFTGFDGYLLNLVGTDEAFSTLRDIEPSAMRQFTRENLSSFEDIEKTKELIVNNLTDEEIKDIDVNSIEEIHLLSEGRPYEINLLSNFMYKNYETKENEKLQLTGKVIEDSFKQLEGLGDQLEIIDQIDNLNEREMDLLQATLEYDDFETFYQYYYLKKFDFTKVPSFDSDEIDNLLIGLQEKNIIGISNGKISFLGNVYAKAYLKYSSIIDSEKKNIGYIEEDSMPSNIINIHKNLVDDLILSEIPETHSHFTIDHESSFQDIKHSLTHIPSVVNFKKEIEPDINKVSQSLGDVNLHKFRANSFRNMDNKQNDTEQNYEYITFRYEIKWLEKGIFVEVMMKPENAEQNKEEVRKLLDAIESKQKDLGIKIIEKDEFYWYTKARSICSKKPKKAISYLNSSLEVNENYIYSLYNRAYHRYCDLDEEKEKVKRDVNKILDLNEDYVAAYNLKASLTLEENGEIFFEQVISKALEKVENKDNFYESLLCVLASADQWNGMKKILDRTNAENDHIRAHEAQYHLNTENEEKCLTLCNQLIQEEGETTSDAYLLKTKSLLSLNKNEKAKEAFSKAYQKEKDYIIREGEFNDSKAILNLLK